MYIWAQVGAEPKRVDEPVFAWLLEKLQLGTSNLMSEAGIVPASLSARCAVTAPPWKLALIKNAAQLLPFVPSPGLTLKLGPVVADSDVHVVPPFGVSC